MSIRYRLGIDLGTASVGLAAFALDADGQPTELVYHHVRLFDEPLESEKRGLKSKAAMRRQARLQRRQIERRARARLRVLSLSSLLGVSPADVKPGDKLPAVRAAAVREPISLPDLMRVFLKLVKKRGYAGDFSEKKRGEVADGARALDAELARVAGLEGKESLSLGEYLDWRHRNGQPVKLKVRDVTSKKSPDEPPNLYALRRHVVREFEIIWETQAAHHPVLNGTHNGVTLKETFRNAIFRQRPLRSVADKVGRCSLEPTLPRAPRAQPAFQHFRIEKLLADLRWGAGRRADLLSPQQKAVIRGLLEEHEEVTFKTVLRDLKKAGCPAPEGKSLNIDRLSRDVLPGNRTNARFKSLGLYEDWRALERAEKISVINFIADLGSPEQMDDPEWATRFARADGTPRHFKPAVRAFLDKLREHEKFDLLSGMKFDAGRASYSVKGLEKLTEWLRDPQWPGDWSGPFRIDEDMALRVCYPAAVVRNIDQSSVLQSPPATGNAVVDKALRQLRWTMQRLMADLGSPPAEIVIEMAREMGLGIKRRNERESDNRKNQLARRRAAEEIAALDMSPTPNRIRRYLLWSEQDYKCPYCGNGFGLREALSGGESEYEHILPRKLTQVGMKATEIVIAHHACNQRKGDRTPWAAAATGDVQWPAVEAMAEALRKKRSYRKAKLLMLQDHEGEVLTDESIAEFADRQFHATAWVTKEAAQWLEPLCPGRVSTSRGELTAMLRRAWKLDSVIAQARYCEGLPVIDEERKPIDRADFEVLRLMLDGHPVRDLRQMHPHVNLDRRPDKRADNRHHLVDAIVTALVSRALFMDMARKYKRAAEKVNPNEEAMQSEREADVRRHVRRELQAPPPPVRGLRESVLRAVAEQHISRKPERYTDAAFFKDTAYSVARHPAEGEVPGLVLRRSVSSLGGANASKVTLASARKGVQTIESPEIRAIISAEFERRVAAGVKPAVALGEPIVHPAFGRPIKRVRCLQGQSSAVGGRVEHVASDGRRHWKYLAHAGYAWLDVWSAERGKPHYLLCTAVDAARAPSSKAPAGVLRLFRGDVVRDRGTGGLYRVCYFKANGTIAIVPLVEPRSFKMANEKAVAGAKTGSFVSAARALKRFDVLN